MSMMSDHPLQGFISSNNAHSVLMDDDPFTNIAQIDWKETQEAHVFRIDLPGLTKDEIKLQLQDGRVLTVSGERREHEEKGDKWHFKERKHGKFLRRFSLPENSKTDQIKATIENGVLTITVPKDTNHEVTGQNKVRVVEICDNDEHHRHAKGLGRFVCCKA